MTAPIEALEATYRVGSRRLVDRVSLRARAGELLAIAGPNGAGKSTLLRLLAGDLEPHKGEVRLLGRPLRAYRLRELARLRAVMPQDTVLAFPYTVRELVELGRYRRADEHAVAAALRAADIAGLATRRWPTLSGGEQGRTTLARVLAQDTPILLLDEPTSSLDIAHQERVLSLAAGLARDGRTVIAVLHDLNLAALHADRIALMRDGELVACAQPWQALEPELLRHVFQTRVSVIPHPDTDRPLVVARPLPRDGV
jgi:iron complex transport system ATP-binding protein